MIVAGGLMRPPAELTAPMVAVVLLIGQGFAINRLARLCRIRGGRGARDSDALPTALRRC